MCRYMRGGGMPKLWLKLVEAARRPTDTTDLYYARALIVGYPHGFPLMLDTLHQVTTKHHYRVG